MKAYLLILGSEHCHDMDEWLGIFTDITELKKAYVEATENPHPDWLKSLKVEIYEFPQNALIKDSLFDSRIRSVSADELNEMVREKEYLDTLRKQFPLFLHIALDEERLKKDGYNPEDMWTEFNNIITGISELHQPRRGLIVTSDSGARSWLTEILEDTPWFMKYVSKWEIDDPTLKENVIESKLIYT